MKDRRWDRESVSLAVWQNEEEARRIGPEGRRVEAESIFLGVIGSTATYKLGQLAEVAARCGVSLDDAMREVRIGHERGLQGSEAVR